ncbi:MAGa3780 family membrane protein [Metamycoplasma buccale]|uniref:MAGa3780 family membrane protein n=1 Tax=Metamycoplasma buccale TaxID=55602 RepID=UPI00398EEAC2
MKNEKQKTNNKRIPIITSIKEFEKRYKAIFIFGVCILLILLAIQIYNFNSSVKKAYEYFKKNPDLINNYEYHPSVLSIIWRRTMSFTMISNWILAISLTIFPFFRKSQRMQALFFATVVFITITFIIYWSLISWTFKWRKNELDSGFINLFTHAITPIFAFISLGMIRKDITIKHSQIWLTNTFVLGYFTYALIAFLIGQRFANLANSTIDPYSVFDITIYKFLNFKKPLFYNGGKIGIVIFLDIIMFLIAFFLTPSLGYMWKGIFRIKTFSNIQNDDDNNVKVNF